jgi:hypothetical protein
MLMFIEKNDVLVIGLLSPSRNKNPTQLGPSDRISPYLQKQSTTWTSVVTNGAHIKTY